MTEHPCLATILDTSRLVRVGRLAEVWPGPISAAVLTAPDTELFAERRLVQAALASMVREPQRLRVTLMENTGCAPRSHSRAAPPLLLSLTSACPPLCPPSQLQLPRPLPFQRAAQPRALPLRRGAGAHRRRRLCAHARAASWRAVAAARCDHRSEHRHCAAGLRGGARGLAREQRERRAHGRGEGSAARAASRGHGGTFRRAGWHARAVAAGAQLHADGSLAAGERPVPNPPLPPAIRAVRAVAACRDAPLRRVLRRPRL